MLALHAVYLDEHEEMREELDFIETPHILYYEEFFKNDLINYMNNILENKEKVNLR